LQLNVNETIFMGKGDKKSKKGKISMGSYGVSRPKRQVKAAAPAPAAKPAAEPKAKAAPKPRKKAE